MKRLKLNINKHLKGIMLALAVVGGSYAATQYITPKSSAHLAFTIGLVAAMKKKGIKLEEAEEKLIGEIDTELNAAFVEVQKGFMTPADFETKVDAKLKDLSVKAADIKIGEGDKAKSIDELMREMGVEITAIKAAGKDGVPAVKDLKVMLEAKMDDLANLLKQKSGSITLSVKAAAVMTTDNTITEPSLPDDILESFSIGGFVSKRRPRQWIFDIADRTTVSEITQYKTWMEEGNEQGAFAIVAEGAVKPLVSYDLVRNVSEVKKIAGKYVVTEEFTKFRKEAYRIIKQLINDKLLRDYAALLTADLVSAAASYTGTALDGQYANPTDYHAVGAVAAQIESLNFVPDVLIMNPQDKWRIGLSQDTVGQFYLNIPMTDPSGETRMMGFTLRTSNYVPVGTFILGEGNLWKIEDEAITIRMGYGVTVTGSNPVTAVVSDFDNNQMRVIVETWFRDYIATNHVGSFVLAEFDTVKEALQGPAIV